MATKATKTAPAIRLSAEDKNGKPSKICEPFKLPQKFKKSAANGCCAERGQSPDGGIGFRW